LSTSKKGEHEKRGAVHHTAVYIMVTKRNKKERRDLKKIKM